MGKDHPKSTGEYSATTLQFPYPPTHDRYYTNIGEMKMISPLNNTQNSIELPTSFCSEHHLFITHQAHYIPEPIYCNCISS